MNEQPVAEKAVLHVGCGRANPSKLHSTFHQKNWREIRLDINPDVSPDIVADITDMNMIDSKSVEAIWSSHNLEHLYPHEVSLAIQEFSRVLKSDGFALITLPDLQAVARLIAADGLDEAVYQSPAGPVAPIDILYGYRPALAAGNFHMAHRTGFTGKTLGKAMLRNGFDSVRVRADQALNLWAIGFKSKVSEELFGSIDGIFKQAVE